MKKRFLLISCAVLFFIQGSLYASDNKYVFDDANASIGLGFVYQQFSGMDSFREGTGLFGDSDKIDYVAGIAFNGELLLNKTFSLQIPYGLALGYRFQTMEGGYEYSGVFGGTFERKVSIKNHIAYISAAVPVDNDKYFLLGVSAGAGVSTYTFSAKWTKKVTGVTYDPDVSESSSGFVFPIGCFFDWGADGFGGRFGCEYVVSQYDKIGDEKPKGNGFQIYLNLRYAI